MTKLIDFAVAFRWQILMATLLFTVIGFYQSQHLPIDAVPDITNVQVQINTEAPGFTPLEVEQRITFPIETGMAGIPGLEMTRSLSRYGLSQVTVIFADGTDIYWARQQVFERLQTLRTQLPEGVNPEPGPISTGLGEIFTYAVVANPDARDAEGKPYTPESLRTLQDWVIRPQLMTVKGITEVNSQGGFVKQYQVTPDPDKLIAYNISLEQLTAALRANNQNTGAGFIAKNGEQTLIRAIGQIDSFEAISRIPVSLRGGKPVFVSDVATVTLGKELRSGAATYNGKEAVLGTTFMLSGENSREVSLAVAKALGEINKTLPKGVTTKPLYNRTTLVDKTIQTVKRNLFEGAILVIVILFLMLGQLRAALIVACVIPLNMLFAIMGMNYRGVTGNLMSLGAIDFGLLVDGAVIIMENAIRRLALRQKELGRIQTLEERLREVTESTVEVFKPAFCGVLVIMMVYLPLFALTGIEGKMFHPMAFTVIAALAGSLFFSATFIPAAIAVFMRGPIVEKEHTLFRRFINRYRQTLKSALKMPAPILGGTLIFTGFTLFLGSTLGTTFLPRLDEQDIALHALRIPGTSLTQSVDMQKLIEQELMTVQEIRQVFSKIGTPDIATDPMPPNVADTFVIMKPRDKWADPKRSKEDLLEEIQHKLASLPGNNYEFTQPIEMRFNELISGVRSDVAIRIYGDNLETLKKLGQQAESLTREIPGASDVRLEQTTGQPYIFVNAKKDTTAILGLTEQDLQQNLQTAIAGEVTGTIYEGDQRFDLIVRYTREATDSVEKLGVLPVFIEGSSDKMHYVPFAEVAHFTESTGLSQINRRNGHRNIVVTANVRDRDLGSFMRELNASLDGSLDLPPGYRLAYGGTFEQMQSANERLQLIVPLTLLAILTLLLLTFRNLKDSLIILTGIPLALTGGILSLSLRGLPLSLSAIVGLIALSGIAILNGMVLVSFMNKRVTEGSGVTEAILDSAAQRLRPILMTALVAGLGFVPMAFNTGVGAEVQRPLATVVIGGILTSTLLTLFVMPVLYHRLKISRGKTRG